jgi:epsilon-lactone hydrolase
MAGLVKFSLRSSMRLFASLMSTQTVQRQHAMTIRSTGLIRLAKGVKSQITTIEYLEAEWLIPDDAPEDQVLLYLHGGGFVTGSNRTHRGMVSHFCKVANIRALLINYRLAPEYPYPAALDDCVMAYRWLLQNGFKAENIIIAGDSAGGNLTLTTMLILRDEGTLLPAAAICISPATDLTGSSESYRINARKDTLLNGWLKFARMYVGDADASSPLISPVFADFKGLPPLLIHVGSDEILLDDANRLAERTRTDGVDVTLEIWPEAFHVWHVYVGILPEAQAAINTIGVFIQKRLKR